MADNATVRGFRWHSNAAGKPDFRVLPVATSYATLLVRGDPLKIAADGSLQRAAAGDVNIVGIMNGVKQYWDGTYRRRGRFLPAVTAWGTDQTKISLVEFIPVVRNLFEVDADDKTTATTEAAYQALVNENCDHVIESVTGNISGAALDISTHVITTAGWRIKNIAKKVNHDFSGLRVKLIVECAESEEPVYTAAVSA